MFSYLSAVGNRYRAAHTHGRLSVHSFCPDHKHDVVSMDSHHGRRIQVAQSVQELEKVMDT